MRMNYSRTGATGLVYDGVNLSDLFQVVNVSIPLLPGIEAVTHDLAQRPGAYFASRKVGTREIRVSLRLDADTRDPMGIFHAWREVSGTISKSEPRRLQLNEDRYCNALLVGESEIANEAYYGVVELTFACLDPHFYGATHEVAMSGGSASSFEVIGSVPALPVLDLTAAASRVVVTNAVTGEYVAVPGLTSGARVTVDMGRQVSTANGLYAPVELLSDYFGVEGSARVSVTGASGTLRYEERYL